MVRSSTTGFKKITEHSDKDEIVEKLIAGESTRNIEKWLKQKYPHNKKLQVSYISLQSFRKNHLKLDAEVLKDLQKERRQLQVQKRAEQEQETVQHMRTYQAGLANYVQDSLIDYNQEILMMMEQCRHGIEQLTEMNDNKGSHLNHQALAMYLEKYKGVIEMHHKMIAEQKKADENKLEEDYETLNRKMEILVESVREAFNQTNPEGLFLFVQLVKDRMQEAGIQE